MRMLVMKVVKMLTKIRAFKAESQSNLAEKQLPEENSDETDQGIIFGFQLFIFLNIKIMTTWRLINKLCTN